jgi:hypothetical protein
MTVRCAAVLAAAALTVAACTGGSVPGKPTASPSPERSNLGQVIDDAPTLRPLSLSPKPLWNQSTKGAMKVVIGAALHGDTAILIGQAKQEGKTQLVVADAMTGKVRWSVKEFGRLRKGDGAVWRANIYGGPQTPQIIGEDENWGVLTNYYLTACRHPTGFCPAGSGPSDETGVALLSGKDGSIRWKLPLVPARTGKAARAANRLTGFLMTTDGKVALATVAPSLNSRFTDIRLIAIDATTGRRLWTRSGVQPTLISGDIVFGRVATRKGQSTLDMDAVAVTALDAATGRTRWTLPSSLLVLAAGGMSLVREVKDGHLEAPRLLAAETGREIARLSELITNCQTDGLSLIACEHQDFEQHRLITIRLDDRRVRVAKREIPDSSLAAVWQGHVFLDDRQDRGYEVDASANRLAEALPGSPVALSDRYAIFQERYSEKPRYSVYRVS